MCGGGGLVYDRGMSAFKWAAVVGVLLVVAAIFGFVLAIEVITELAQVVFFILLAALVALIGLGVWTYKKVT